METKARRPGSQRLVKEWLSKRPVAVPVPARSSAKASAAVPLAPSVPVASAPVATAEPAGGTPAVESPSVLEADVDEDVWAGFLPKAKPGTASAQRERDKWIRARQAAAAKSARLVAAETKKKVSLSKANFGEGNVLPASEEFGASASSSRPKRKEAEKDDKTIRGADLVGQKLPKQRMGNSKTMAGDRGASPSPEECKLNDHLCTALFDVQEETDPDLFEERLPKLLVMALALNSLGPSELIPPPPPAPVEPAEESELADHRCKLMNYYKLFGTTFETADGSVHELNCDQNFKRWQCRVRGWVQRYLKPNDCSSLHLNPTHETDLFLGWATAYWMEPSRGLWIRWSLLRRCSALRQVRVYCQAHGSGSATPDPAGTEQPATPKSPGGAEVEADGGLSRNAAKPVAPKAKRGKKA